MICKIKWDYLLPKGHDVTLCRGCCMLVSAVIVARKEIHVTI